MNVAIDDVRAWGLDVALVLDRLVDGDLRGMFDGPTTVGIDLDAPLIVFDLSHIDRNSIAMPILMAIVGVWLEHTWIRPDRKKRIFLVEEAWHIINSPFVAQLFQRLLKFGRRLGLSFVAVVHHLSDVVDGAAAKEAAAILKMASTRTIYAQKADEARATGRVLGLPRWAVEIIPTLTPGIAVWDVNGNVQVVKHLITETERPLVFTDRAMTESSADRSSPTTRWRRRAGGRGASRGLHGTATARRPRRLGRRRRWRDTMRPDGTATERTGRHPGRPARRPPRLPAGPDAPGLDGHRASPGSSPTAPGRTA